MCDHRIVHQHRINTQNAEESELLTVKMVALNANMVNKQWKYHPKPMNREAEYYIMTTSTLTHRKTYKLYAIVCKINVAHSTGRQIEFASALSIAFNKRRKDK